jgi:hypothetical protein
LKRDATQSKNSLDWLARRLFWFLLVPVMTILGYFSSIRPFFVSQFGTYTSGFIDGALFIFAVTVASIWIFSKIDRIQL